MQSIFQIEYLKSEFNEGRSIELHNWKDVEYYEKVGYVINEEQEKLFKLEKKAEVKVFIGFEHSCYVFRVTEQILEFYEKSVMTSELFERFKTDAECDRICFLLDTDNNRIIFEGAPN